MIRFFVENHFKYKLVYGLWKVEERLSRQTTEGEEGEGLL